MKLNKEQQMELADCLLNMGQLLLDCGAEISRVEETISRMGVAYGATHVEVFVITYSLTKTSQTASPICA